MKAATASDPTGIKGLATPLVALDEIDSTNTEAVRRAQSGVTGPLWITARHQTRGKGRAGRSFQSPAGGNLYASLLLSLAAPATTLPQISLLAGIAAYDAISTLGDGIALAGLRLKWPNDLLIGDAKLVGILTETTASTPGSTGSNPTVIGWGINVVSHPTDLGRPATSLAAHGLTTTADAVLAALDRAVFHWLAVWADGTDFGSIRTAWLQRAGAAGERLVVNRGDGGFEGVFLGLDEDGALLLADGAGRPQRVTYGDVTFPDSIRRTEDTLPS